MSGYTDLTKLESSRNCLRRIARHDEQQFSIDSIVNVMEKFVKTVNVMDETILVPCRLMDRQIGDSFDTITAPAKNLTANQLASTSNGQCRRGDGFGPNVVASMHSKNIHEFLHSSELFNLYTMLNSLKNELLWSGKNEARDIDYELEMRESPSASAILTMVDDGDVSNGGGSGGGGGGGGIMAAVTINNNATTTTTTTTIRHIDVSDINNDNNNNNNNNHNNNTMNGGGVDGDGIGRAVKATTTTTTTTTKGGNTTKGHNRRPSTASVASTASVSNLSDAESDISVENDSGVESEGHKIEHNNLQCSEGGSISGGSDVGGATTATTATTAITSNTVGHQKKKATTQDRSTELARRCKRHLNGLYQCLEQMTEAANYLTARYQSDIGPV